MIKIHHQATCLQEEDFHRTTNELQQTGLLLKCKQPSSVFFFFRCKWEVLNPVPPTYNPSHPTSQLNPPPHPLVRLDSCFLLEITNVVGLIQVPEIEKSTSEKLTSSSLPFPSTSCAIVISVLLKFFILLPLPFLFFPINSLCTYKKRIKQKSSYRSTPCDPCLIRHLSLPTISPITTIDINLSPQSYLLSFGVLAKSWCPKYHGDKDVKVDRTQNIAGGV